MKRVFTFVIFIGTLGGGLFLILSLSSQPSQKILFSPIPQNQIRLDGKPFHLNAETQILCLSQKAVKELTHSGLTAKIEKKTLHTPHTSITQQASKAFGDDAVNTIIIGEFSSLKSSSFMQQLPLRPTKVYPGPEGYILSVSADRILVAGRDSAGIFFGLQSLKFMLNKDEIPAMEVVDWPEYPMRAIYLALNNVSSKTMTTARAVVHHAAKLKYNQVSIVLGNGGYARLDMQSSQPGKSIGDILRKFFAYCMSHHITPRPEGNSRFFPSGSYPHKNSYAGDPTMLEGIRTTEKIILSGIQPVDLTIQLYDQNNRPVDQPVAIRNVIHDIHSGKTWNQEPVVIQSTDGSITYLENYDYLVTYGDMQAHWFKTTHFGKGQPKGSPFSVLRWAEYEDTLKPTSIRRLPGSHIPDGKAVSVEFTYLAPDPYSRWKYRECLSDHRLYEKKRTNPLYRLCSDIFDNVDNRIGYFGLEVDEYRSLGWDNRCLNSGLSRAQLWSHFIEFQTDILLDKQPNLKVIMWSDMIDPFHNGELYGTTGSGELLAEQGYSKHIIAQPWHSGKADSSVRYLSSLGFNLLPSCQGKGPDNDIYKWRFYTDKYCKIGSIAGFQYTQWEGIRGWEKILEKNTKESGALRIVSQSTWSRAPHIAVLPIQKKGGTMLISAQVTGDIFHYTPKGTSGRVKIADDAGAGGRGKVIIGPCPLASVTLHVRKENNSNSIIYPMKLSRGKKIYSAIVSIDQNTTSFFIQASDKQHTTRIPQYGWIHVK